MPSGVFIITGEQGSGKTTFLQHVVRLLKEQNITVCGILALGFWNHNQRDHFDLLDVKNEKHIRFCQRNEVDGWEKIRHFYVNPAGQSFGEMALSVDQLQDCPVVVVDEVGPFELEGKGWAKPLDKLFSTEGITVVITVRTSLLQEVTRHWNIQNFTLMDIEHTVAEDCAKAIQKEAGYSF